ncbi:MAG: repressor LexA [Clostridia bacterium]|nr:repressor LexA [Clostridia bacterium]
MRYLSEETKERIINFVDSYYANNGYTPTISTIAKSLRLSDGVVHKYLHRMTESDELTYDGRHIITPRIEAVQSRECVDISGQITCGEPVYAEQEYGDSISLPSSLVGQGKFFILKAKGNSMINIGIADGDLVVLRQQNYADEGQVIAALVDNDSATLKRYTVDRKNKKIVLLAENENYAPIVRDEISIMGVLVYLLKDMKHL